MNHAELRVPEQIPDLQLRIIHYSFPELA
jgi:hypothetical protein